MSVDVLENVGVEELSKNQLKKRKRYALYLEKKALRTQLRREKKRARRKTAHSDAAVKDSDKCLTISTETSSKSDCAVKDPIKCLTILPEASSSSDCAACPALPRVSRAVRHREGNRKKKLKQKTPHVLRCRIFEEMCIKSYRCGGLRIRRSANGGQCTVEIIF